MLQKKHDSNFLTPNTVAQEVSKSQSFKYLNGKNRSETSVKKNVQLT